MDSADLRELIHRAGAQVLIPPPRQARLSTATKGRCYKPESENETSRSSWTGEGARKKTSSYHVRFALAATRSSRHLLSAPGTREVDEPFASFKRWLLLFKVDALLSLWQDLTLRKVFSPASSGCGLVLPSRNQISNSRGVTLFAISRSLWSNIFLPSVCVDLEVFRTYLHVRPYQP